MKTITLSTKKQLDIFMSPQRQQLLRVMRLSGLPMTAKALGSHLGISASSAAHHIKKLESLGLVTFDHTENIRGITARYYRLCDVNVSIGITNDGTLSEERYILMQNMLYKTMEGFRSQISCALEKNIPKDELIQNGDFLSGVVHLTQKDAMTLLTLIRDYIKTHEKRSDDTQPWEYALILYNSGQLE